jgi:hypothetical protein
MRFVLILLATVLVNTALAAATPRQRVVISDNYTSWLLKGEGTERYGEGEALPKLLAEGWTIRCGSGQEVARCNALFLPTSHFSVWQRSVRFTHHLVARRECAALHPNC